MKTFDEYINESKQNYIFGGTDDRNTTLYQYAPKDREELVKILEEKFFFAGQKSQVIDLNVIDVSNVDDMHEVFECLDYAEEAEFDVSEWDVSNVTDMRGLFGRCHMFNCDISKWDVSNVETMQEMFAFARNFNQDISKWDVSNVENMNSMFYNAEKFNCDISSWDMRNVADADYMLMGANAFSQDLSRLNVDADAGHYDIFAATKIKNNKKCWPKAWQQ